MSSSSSPPDLREDDAGDHLKHLGLGNRSHNLRKMFGDVKVKTATLGAG